MPINIICSWSPGHAQTLNSHTLLIYPIFTLILYSHFELGVVLRLSIICALTQLFCSHWFLFKDDLSLPILLELHFFLLTPSWVIPLRVHFFLLTPSWAIILDGHAYHPIFYVTPLVDLLFSLNLSFLILFYLIILEHQPFLSLIYSVLYEVLIFYDLIFDHVLNFYF